MTTESKQVTLPGVFPVLLGAAAVSLSVGLAATVTAGLTSGSAAAGGAVVGTSLVVLVFGTSSFVVDVVAAVMPSAALLVALLTYTLQVLLMGLVFLALSRSDLLGRTLDRAWLAGSVIAATVAWLVVQVVLTTRLRIPAYDLAPAAQQGGER